MQRLVILSLFLLSLSLGAVPPGHRKHPPKLLTETRLVGHWHSTSLSGDAVGLAVSDVVVEFRGGKKFHATINMNIGGPSVYEGEYHARRQMLTLHPVSQSAIPCTVTFHSDDKITVVATQQGVTAVFERGEAPASSGGWF